MRDHGRAVRTRVGRMIQQLRQHRGLSQEALAEHANNSAKTIGRIERGEVGVAVDSLDGIARALSVTLADLVVEPRGRRSTKGAVHILVLNDEELASVKTLGAVARRIK